MHYLLTGAIAIGLCTLQMSCAQAGELQQFREIGQFDIDAYFSNLPAMTAQKEWKKLTILGETALEACQTLGNKASEFEITAQMVLSYARMEDIDRSLFHISKLQELASGMPNKKLVVENFCKIAAFLQSFADFLEEDGFAKGRLLNEAWVFNQEAEQIAANDPELLSLIH